MASDANSGKVKILPPDHPFMVAVRELDLPRIKELAGKDNSLVDAQVRGHLSLSGDGGRELTAEEITERTGPLHFAAFNRHNELANPIDCGAGSFCRLQVLSLIHISEPPRPY